MAMAAALINKRHQRRISKISKGEKQHQQRRNIRNDIESGGMACVKSVISEKINVWQRKKESGMAAISDDGVS